MKNVVLWNVMPWSSRKNRCFSLLTAYVVPSSLALSTMIMETIHSPEKLVFARTTRRYIPENGIILRLLFNCVLCCL
jgi:hypothetical protein